MKQPTTLIQGPMEGRSVLYQVSLAAHAGTSAILTPAAVAAIYDEVNARIVEIDETIKRGQDENAAAVNGLHRVKEGLGGLHDLLQAEFDAHRRTIAGCGWVIIVLAVANVIGWLGWVL